jgi:hypothetical protein
MAWVLGMAGLYVFWTVFEFEGRLRYSALIANEATAPGVVTKCEPNNHNSFTALFSVGPASYESGGFIEDIGRCYVGQRVTADYQADKPSNNCVCDPNQRLADTWHFPIEASLLLGPVMPFIYISWSQRRRLDSADEDGHSNAGAGQSVERARRTLSRPSPLIWLWSTGRVLYELPFTPDEVSLRLSGALQSDSRASPSPDSTAVTLAGWAKDGRFQLVVRGGSRLRTWFESILDGTIRAARGGSLVMASFRLGGLLLASGATLLAFTVVIATWTVAASITHTPQLSLLVIVPLIPGLGLFVIGRIAGGAPDRALLTALDRVFGVDSERAAESWSSS